MARYVSGGTMPALLRLIEAVSFTPSTGLMGAVIAYSRRKYERAGQRYASDLTEAEWTLIEPSLPGTKPLGRPRETDLRAVLEAILYIARTGCQWRMLPKDFPPFTTVQLFLRLAGQRLV